MPDYDVFISYARVDDAGGWVSGLRDAVYHDFREFSSEPFRIFFDTTEIRSHQLWEDRLREGLRSSRVLLVCLSPNYLRSEWCRREWEEFTRMQARRVGGGDAVTGVYFVDLGGNEDYGEQIASWRHELERVQFEQLQPWFPNGVKALQEAEVRHRVKALGQGVYEQLREARLAKQAPGNLRRHNPHFVGRVQELRALRSQLTGGAAGVVTAVHGIGGTGKTELAVTYAHAYAHAYQGGTWQIDAEGQTDLLEAVSALALSPELGLEVREEHLSDRQWLGRRVLVRLAERTEVARKNDPDTAACLILLDNVSEPDLLAQSQLALLPDQPWFQVMVTTRLGANEITGASSRPWIATVEVGRLDAEDALTLMREHQPARDPARLHADFSSPQEADAARRIAELLDGYALAVEQAAVYLGTCQVEPSALLALLQAEGSAVLDDVGNSPEGATAILHKEKLVGSIVDQALHKLDGRAREALGFASLLPPNTVPWEWLRDLTRSSTSPPASGLPGLSGKDGWASTRRVLEGRRLLTAADDARFARLHRVLAEHLRIRLVSPEALDRLDEHVNQVSEELRGEATPDITLLAIAAATVTNRLVDGRYELSVVGDRLLPHIEAHLDLAGVQGLAAAMVNTFDGLAAGEPARSFYQFQLAVNLGRLGHTLAVSGDTQGALTHYTRAVQVCEELAASDPVENVYHHELARSLERVGNMLEARGDTSGALDRYSRALHIDERLAAANPGEHEFRDRVAGDHIHLGDIATARGDGHDALDHFTHALQLSHELAAAEPANTKYQTGLLASHGRIGDVLAARGDTSGALDHYTRALHICEELSTADPANHRRRHGLSQALGRVGNMLAAGDDTEGALDYYARALRVCESLAVADPTNIRYQSSLTSLLQQIGDELEGLDDTDGALDHYTRALHICEKLVAVDPANSGDQRGLATCHTNVGRLLAERGDTEDAISHYRCAVQICEGLVATDPGDARNQQALWTAAAFYADLLESTGDPAAADYVAKAHDTLAALDAVGALSDSGREFIDLFARKLGQD